MNKLNRGVSRSLNGVARWPSGSALDSQSEGPGFESRCGNMGYCVIPV